MLDLSLPQAAPVPPAAAAHNRSLIYRNHKANLNIRARYANPLLQEYVENRFRASTKGFR